MPEFPYFPFYPKDFLGDSKVAVMSTLEVGAYVRLLCYAWHESPIGSLSDRSATLQRLAQLSLEEWERHSEAILAPFELRDGRYFQKRMVAEAAKLRRFSEARSRGAQVTNEKRWGVAERSDSDRLAVGNQSHNQTHNQKENKQKPTRKLAGSVDLVLLPECLDSEEFRAALQHWIDHKKLKRDPMTQHAIDLLVKKCAAMGLNRSLAAIEHSIEKGWRSVNEEVQIQVNGSHAQTAKPKFVTYEKVANWCSRKGWTKLTEIAWGKLMGGTYYGRPITNEVDFNAAMSAIYEETEP